MPIKPDLLKRFGTRLRALRMKEGFSQEGFAAVCGLDRTYIGGIERGERNVSIKNLAIIAQSLGLSISDLTKDL